jgi:trimethylamine monooxygenase
MFDAQAWYARDYMLGKISLPLKEKMTANSLEWRKREDSLKDDEQKIWFQGDYTKELIEATDYPNFDIEGVNKTFMEWEHHKHEDIMTFRNNSYKSLITGKKSPEHHTPWLEELDDSLKAYLK